MQTQGAFMRGQAVVARAPLARAVRAPLVQVTAEAERFRLNNLGPAPGSRRQKMRKGRGYGAGQGATCGYGMRGQNARSGSSTRPGFEGGQIPLYRRLPKLKGIAGGMGAGLPNHVVINLSTISEKFSEGETVSLSTLKEKRVLNVSGRDAKLGLKVLGTGELSVPVTIQAEQFSAAALEKIEGAGGTAEVIPKKPKWTRAAHEAKKAAKK